MLNGADGKKPTPEQVRMIEAGPAPTLVIAGAGSGKTATMVDRVIWLVDNGFVRPEEVLGVTFTRKAATELRSRMRAGLTLCAVAAASPRPMRSCAKVSLTRPCSPTTPTRITSSRSTVCAWAWSRTRRCSAMRRSGSLPRRLCSTGGGASPR